MVWIVIVLEREVAMMYLTLPSHHSNGRFSMHKVFSSPVAMVEAHSPCVVVGDSPQHWNTALLLRDGHSFLGDASYHFLCLPCSQVESHSTVTQVALIHGRFAETLFPITTPCMLSSTPNLWHVLTQHPAYGLAEPQTLASRVAKLKPIHQPLRLPMLPKVPNLTRQQL